MPCPLFIPVSPLGDFSTRAMPLGDVFGGRCACDADALIPIDTLRSLCNLGYARRKCDRAAGCESDAVRFLIVKDGRDRLDVAWSLERDHHPVSVGELEIVLNQKPSGEVLEAQARAYAAGYLRRSPR